MIDRERIFWRYFFATIIVMAVIFLGLNYFAYLKISKEKKHNSQVNSQNRQNRQNRIVNSDQKLAIKLLDLVKDPNVAQKMVDAVNINDSELKRIIDTKIDALFEPVYDNIPKLSEFHYSVTGEYTTLIKSLTGGLKELIKNKIFGDDFEDNLRYTLEEIKSDIDNIIDKKVESVENDISVKYDLPKEKVQIILKRIFNFSYNDIKNHFDDYTFNLYGNTIGAGSVGAVIGGIGGAIAAKLAAKIAAKIAAKMGLKAAGIGGSCATGACMGSIFGPVGTAAGGVIGAIVGWFAVDKVVVEVDKFLNEDDFKRDMKYEIDSQKDKLKSRILEEFKSKLSNFEKFYKKKIEETRIKNINKLKDEPIKDFVFGD